jgi:CBS domain-containing protein
MVSIDRNATVASASKLMRAAKVDELLVTEKIAGSPVPKGVVSARDIVVRVLGVDLDPQVFTVGDLLWQR